MAGVEVRGTGNVLANMAKVLISISKSVENEVEQAAFSVEREAKIICPVDTGRLRASITADKKDELHYEVGTNVEYAGYVEFGTKKMAAQPYLGPAADKVRQKYPRLVGNGVAQEIRKVL